MAQNERDPFTPGQPVWLIDSDPVESSTIRSNLSPKVINIFDFDLLAETISKRLNSDEQAFGTLIFTQNIPGELKTNWGTTITAINNENINPKLFIYHVTNENFSPFNNAKVFSEITDFLEFANEVHLEKITDDDSLSEEARKIIKDMKIQVSKLTNDKDNLKKELEQNISKVDTLNSKLDSSAELLKRYLSDKESAEEKAKKAEEERDKTNLNFESKTRTIADLRKQILDLSEQLNTSETKSDAAKQTIEQQTIQINELTQQIKDLEFDLSKKDEESKSLLSAKTEFAAMGELQEKYDATVNLLRKNREEINSLKSEVAIKENKVNLLQSQLELYRDSDSTKQELGYSNVFQKIELKRTNVMYFKIIDQLPFHRFYINTMVEQLKSMLLSQGINRKIKIIMMKVDQGNDKKRFSEYTFIGDLEGAATDHDKFYLIPSRKMGENAYRFEQSDDVIVFLDYIDNDEIYLNTNGVSDNYVILNHSKDLGSVYDLKGQVISYDHRSLIDIKYDKSIKSMTSQNRDEKIFNTITPILQNSNVVQDIFNI